MLKKFCDNCDEQMELNKGWEISYKPIGSESEREHYCGRDCTFAALLNRFEAYKSSFGGDEREIAIDLARHVLVDNWKVLDRPMPVTMPEAKAFIANHMKPVGVDVSLDGEVLLAEVRKQVRKRGGNVQDVLGL